MNKSQLLSSTYLTKNAAATDRLLQLLRMRDEGAELALCTFSLSDRVCTYVRTPMEDFMLRYLARNG